jgi:hypothetical protein
MPLLTTNTLPPGGWLYEQLRSGVLFKVFNSMGTYADFIKGILSVRVANALPGATLEEVDAEVQGYTCSRLGNDRRWCAPGTGPVVAQQAESTFYAVTPSGGGCAGCGGSKIS